RRSTTSTSTTPAASSPPRTWPPVTAVPRGEDARSYLVDGGPPAPEPDARADLDRSPPDPADDLAPPLRPALLARPEPARRSELLRRVPAPRDRRHERVLRRDLGRDGHDHRPRPPRAPPLPGHVC